MRDWILKTVCVSALFSLPLVADTHDYDYSRGSRGSSVGTGSLGGDYGAGTCDDIRPGDYSPQAQYNPQPLVTQPQPSASTPSVPAAGQPEGSSEEQAAAGSEEPPPPLPKDQEPKGEVAFKCVFKSEGWSVWFDVDKDKKILVGDYSAKGSERIPMSCEGNVCQTEVLKNNAVERSVKIELEDNLKWIKYWPNTSDKTIKAKRVEVDCPPSANASNLEENESVR